MISLGLLIKLAIVYCIAIGIIAGVLDRAIGSNFDGTWTASIASRDARCSSMTTDVIVSGGTIYRHGQPGGSVSPSGAVSLSGMDEYGRGSGHGALSGNSGRGSWRASGRGGSCSGSWSATRK